MVKQLMKEAGEQGIDLGLSEELEPSPERPKEDELQIMNQKTVVDGPAATGGDLIIAEEVEKGGVTFEDVNAYLSYSYGS